MLAVRTLLLSTTLAGCDAGEPNPMDDLPDGPFVRGVLHDVDGSTKVVTAESTYTHDGTTATCSGEQDDHAIVLTWPHQQIAVGDFDLDDDLEARTSTPLGEGILEVLWSGWIQFDTVGDQSKAASSSAPTTKPRRA